jgi:hypothetical protein
MSAQQQDNRRLTILAIHANFENGNNKDAVALIKEYGTYEFWADYKEYLDDILTVIKTRYDDFANAVILYSRLS